MNIRVHAKPFTDPYTDGSTPIRQSSRLTNGQTCRQGFAIPASIHDHPMVKHFAAEVPAAFHSCDVHILGDSEGDFLTCSDVFMAHAGDVFFDECLERGLGSVGQDRRLQVVILHMGDCVTQHWVIDLLKDFRRRNPSAVVIVGSRDIENDDLTCEWVELCDVFMRVPTSPMDMIAAYRVASAR